MKRKVVNRFIEEAINRIPSDVMPDGYPSGWTALDILSVEWQSKSFYEINPLLDDYIYDMLADFNSRLSDDELRDLGCEAADSDKVLFAMLGDCLNEHYATTEKIAEWELTQ